MDIRPDDVCLALAAIVGVAGGVFDLRSSHRIPNYFTYSSAACGIVLRGVLGGWRDLLSALAAAMITFFLMAIFYRLHAMGGGDVKLMTAVAAFAAMNHVFLHRVSRRPDRSGHHPLEASAWKAAHERLSHPDAPLPRWHHPAPRTESG